MNSISFLVGFFTVVAMTSCGHVTDSADKTKISAVGGAKTFDCTMAYSDTSIQADPLYSEAFEATPNQTPVTKKFGYSPGDDSYFALVVPNTASGASDEVALVISKEKGLHTTAIYNQNSDLLFSILNVTDSQMFALVCRPKA